jgi:ssRNA-specific RNase YbeY (16S rRNA maturation enzyme)
LTLALVSNRQMRELNLGYRGKDYATDVLSFPAADPPHPDPFPVHGERQEEGVGAALRPDEEGRTRADRLRAARKSRGRGAVAENFPSPAGRGVRGEGRQLGDIVIARGVAARQAREAGHSVRTELRVLALHGLLHLLGYDHERDRGEMARVERRLRRRGGLREGLIERAV